MDSLFASNDEPWTVLVIGGGLAGLAASQALVRAGRRVLVLEAQPELGGRVHQMLVGGVLAEAGAEFLHGSDSASKVLADAIRLPTERVFTAAHGDGGPDDQPAPNGGVALYIVDGATTLAHDSDDPGFVALNAALGKLGDAEATPDGETRSIADYLRDEGVPPRMIALAAASYSNTLGVGDALDELPLSGVSRLERLWSEHDGDGDYRVDAATSDAHGPPRSLAAYCSALSQGAVVHTRSAVVRLEVTPASQRAAPGDNGGTPCPIVIATCSNGSRWAANAAVIAVPVSVLQRNELSFAPPLPDDKVGTATKPTPVLSWTLGVRCLNMRIPS